MTSLASRTLALALLVIVTAGEATAQDAGVDASGLARIADEAERRADPAAAERAWSAVIAAAPTSRHALRASRRLAWLRERAEGAYVPLASLMRVRQMSEAARDAAILEAFEREASAFPPGRVRIEARALIAGEWARLGDDARAIDAYRALQSERGATETDRALGSEGLAAALHRSGRSAEALDVLERVGMEGTEAGATIARDRRRALLAPLSWAVLAMLMLVVALSSWPALRRAPREVLRRALAPARIAAAAWVTLGPWAIASAYDHEASDTFGLLALGSLSVLALGSVAGASMPRSSSRARRLGVATAVVLGELAIAYLVIDRAGPLLAFG